MNRLPSRRGWVGRTVSAIVALASALLCALLVAHHPLSPLAMAMACLMLAALTFARFVWWPLWLLPLLPLAGLMPWTGWLLVEEWDLLVLAVVAAGHARLAMAPDGQDARAPGAWWSWILLTLWMALTWTAMQRGVADAGGWAWSWWQGYREPLNSLRLAKPVMLVVGLFPLWTAAQRLDAAASTRALRAGMALLGLAASLPVWWERQAFTGLLDFSSDYRATGLFWEMHVGGAGLDLALAISAPFVAAAVLRARSARNWLWSSALGVVLFYAAMATFSRIVYVAVPLGVAVVWVLQSRSDSLQGRPSAAGLQAVALVGLCAAAAAWFFPIAGYRGMLALWAALPLVVVAASRAAELARGQAVAASMLGVLLAACVLLMTAWMNKGAYVAYGLLWLAAGAMLALRARASTLVATDVLGVAGVLGLLAAVPAVGWHWAGTAGLERGAWLALGMLILYGVLTRIPPRRWPWLIGWRWPAQVALGSAAALAVVGVFSGGAYMGGRFTASGDDTHSRTAHWHVLLDLLRTPDQRLLGFGLGRAPAQLAMSGRPELRAGDSRWVADGPESGHLRLASAAHGQSWGYIFRVSQRIDMPAPGPLRLRARIKPEVPVSVHAEACEKHLLYNGNCLIGKLGLAKGLGEWQAVEFELQGNAPSHGHWYAPRLIEFSIALDSEAGRADVDDLQLLDASGRDLLNNGGFDQGLARWYTSSDHHHMPWHAKNLAVHIWFEQGPIALIVLGIAVTSALYSLALGRARVHPLAPALAAALVGALAVALVDSVFDMPRLAFLFLWLLVVTLALPSGGQGTAPRPRS